MTITEDRIDICTSPHQLLWSRFALADHFEIKKVCRKKEGNPTLTLDRICS